jgi:predicted nucleic acid-binding protein
LTRVALDSNVLVYGVGIARAPQDEGKIAQIEHLLPRLVKSAEIYVSTQCLGETYNVMVKSGIDRASAMKFVSSTQHLYSTVAPSIEVFEDALRLATEHHLQFWDALILAGAVQCRCTLLLSEEMQDGFSWQGVTILNPLAERAEKLLFG